MVIMVDGWQARQHGDRGPAEECCLGHLLKLYSEHMYTIVQCTVYSTVQYSAQVSGATLSTLCPTLTVLELHPPHTRDRMAAYPHP